MAVSLVSQPTTPNAAHTKLVYVVSGSGTTSNPQYSYVMDIYLSGSSERLNRLTQVPNPDGVAEFDASSTFISHQGYDNQWKCLISGSVNHGLPYRVHFGEQYGTSTSSSITVYPDLVTSSIQIFNGIVDPNYKYDIAKDSYNWGLNSSGNNFPSASFVQTRRGTPQTIWNQSSFLTNDPTKHFGRPRRAYPVYNETTSSAFQIPNVYKVVDKEDYETVSIFNNFSLPYDDGFGTVYTGSMNDTLLSGSLMTLMSGR